MPQSFHADEALLQGCLRGDARAWDEFVTRFSRLIYWAIRRVLSDSRFAGQEDMVSDIFQDVFRKIYEKNSLLLLKDANNLKKFLIVLSTHQTLDHIKNISRMEKKNVSIDEVSFGGRGEADLTPAVEIQAASSPAEKVSEREKHSALSEAIESLPPRERACLEFHLYDEKTHREIGELLGITQDTASSLVRRAKEKIKEKISKKGFLF